MQWQFFSASRTMDCLSVLLFCLETWEGSAAGVLNESCPQASEECVSVWGALAVSALLDLNRVEPLVPQWPALSRAFLWSVQWFCQHLVSYIKSFSDTRSHFCFLRWILTRTSQRAEIDWKSWVMSSEKTITHVILALFAYSDPLLPHPASSFYPYHERILKVDNR